MDTLNSGLAANQNVECIKYILLMECLLLLNTLTSKTKIKPDEIELMTMKFSDAQKRCIDWLNEVNKIMKIEDYISKKLDLPRKRTLTVDKPILGVISMNFHVNLFFKHFRDQLLTV